MYVGAVVWAIPVKRPCIQDQLPLIIFTGSISAQGSYTEGAWPIHINDLNCTGSEESVWECPHNGIKGYSCNHWQDASVICQGARDISC